MKKTVIILGIALLSCCIFILASGRGKSNRHSYALMTTSRIEAMSDGETSWPDVLLELMEYGVYCRCHGKKCMRGNRISLRRKCHVYPPSLIEYCLTQLQNHEITLEEFDHIINPNCANYNFACTNEQDE